MMRTFSDTGDVAVLSVVGCGVSGVGRVLAGVGCQVVSGVVGDREGFLELEGVFGGVERGVWGHRFAVERRVGGRFVLPMWVEQVYGERVARVIERARVRALGEPLTVLFPGPPALLPLLASRLDRLSVVVVAERPEEAAVRLVRDEFLSPAHALAVWEQQTRDMLELMAEHGGVLWSDHVAFDPLAVENGSEGWATYGRVRDAARGLLTGSQSTLMRVVEGGGVADLGVLDRVGEDESRWGLVELEQEGYRARIHREVEQAEALEAARRERSALEAKSEGVRAEVKDLRAEVMLLRKRMKRRSVRVALRLARLLRPLIRATRRAQRVNRTDPPTADWALSTSALSSMVASDWNAAVARWTAFLEEAGPEAERSGHARAGQAISAVLAGQIELPAESGAGNSSSTSGHKNHSKDVVFTATTGGMDGAWHPIWTHSGFRYVHFSDEPVETLGLYEVRPLEFVGADDRRSARWVKTHPHVLFPESGWAVWMDGNVIALEPWQGAFHDFIKSGAPIGLNAHPLRSVTKEEIEACQRFHKDASRTLQEQLERLGPDSGIGLFETNIVMFNLRHPQLKRLLAMWWSMIEGGSVSDEIALSYAIQRLQLEPHLLFEPPLSLRSPPPFAFVPHEGDPWERARRALVEKVGGPVVDPENWAGRWKEQKHELLRRQTLVRVDVVIPVHNAPAETAACVTSVLETRTPAVHNVILVDDGSGEETATLLAGVAHSEVNVQMLRSDVATGFARAVNRGLEVSTADMVVILNSDTVVPKNWIEKLADAMFRPENVGIVGPMSNAAGLQSWPRYEAGPREHAVGQTAINGLPDGMNLEDVNCLLEEHAPMKPVRSPLVHGFCLAVRREVIEDIGFLDEVFFPEGFGEEDDYCLRAVDAGWTLAWAINTYVWHEKSASYGSLRRQKLVQRGKERSNARYGVQRRAIAVRSARELRRSLRLPIPQPGDPSSPEARVRSAVPVSQRPRLGLLLPGGTDEVQWPGSAHVRMGRFLTHPDVEHAGKVGVLPGFKHFDYVTVSQNAFINYIPEALEELLGRSRHVTLDLDDPLHHEHLFDLTSEHRSIANEVRDFIQRVDALTVSTERLHDDLKSFGKPVRIVPNLLDERLWFEPMKPKPQQDLDPTVFRVLYAGGWTHARDLELLHEVVPRLRRRMGDRVEVHVVGGAKHFDSDVFNRVEVPNGFYPDYVRLLRSIASGFHVAVAPLEDNAFNGFKSDLRYLEYSALGLATVASKVPAFRNTVVSGQNGLLVGNSVDEWVAAMSAVLWQRELRTRIATQAARYVSEERSIRAGSRAWIAAHLGAGVDPPRSTAGRFDMPAG